MIFINLVSFLNMVFIYLFIFLLKLVCYIESCLEGKNCNIYLGSDLMKKKVKITICQIYLRVNFDFFSSKNK